MTIQKFVVTADQMRQIETRIFAAGMPVAALMEKVAGLIALRIQALLKGEGSSTTSSVRDLTDRRKTEEKNNLVHGWGEIAILLLLCSIELIYCSTKILQTATAAVS